MRTRMAVGALIGWKDNPGHVVLVKKIKTEDIGIADIAPEWDIPKGGKKARESDEAALWRELQEEVGSRNFKLVQRLPFKMSFRLPRGSGWVGRRRRSFAWNMRVKLQISDRLLVR